MCQKRSKFDNIRIRTSSHPYRIPQVITGCVSSTHDDKTAASWSLQLQHFMDNLPPDYVILGDPAYRGLHPKVLTTFIGHNLLTQHQRFNDSYTRIRQIVELHRCVTAEMAHTAAQRQPHCCKERCPLYCPVHRTCSRTAQPIH